jgi:hypothetical protein
MQEALGICVYYSLFVHCALPSISKLLKPLDSWLFTVVHTYQSLIRLSVISNLERLKCLVFNFTDLTTPSC